MRRRSLRKSLLTAFVCIGLLPVIILGTYALTQTRKPANPEIARRISMGMDTGISMFEEVLNGFSQKADVLLKSDNVKAFIAGKNIDEPMLYRQMYDVNINNEYNAIVSLSDREGNILKSIGMTESDFDASSRQHKRALSLYKSDKGTSKFYPCNYTLKNGTKVSLCNMKEIIENGELKGYVFVDIPADVISDILKDCTSVQIGNSNISLNFIVYTWYNYIVLNEAFPLETNMLELEFRDQFKTDTVKSEYFSYGDTEYLLTGKLDSDENFIIVGVVPVSLMHENSRQLFVALIFICCISLIASIIISILMTRSVSESVNKMIASMRNVETGDFKTVIPKGKYDEISTLSEQMNGMIMQLDKLFAQNNENQKLLYEAERDSLQAQIRPHFIYNVLGAIRYLIKLGQVSEAEEMLENLGVILKRHIKNSIPTETVEESLDFVNAYIDIQQACYSDKIAVSYSIDEDILSEIIPTFMLQPIVENAIVHGLEPKIGKGSIRISGTRRKEFLIFSVEDDGIGIDENKLKDLLKPGHEEHGNGVYNVDRRVKLFCGEDCGLEITSIQGKGTTVIIKTRTVNKTNISLPMSIETNDDSIISDIGNAEEL